MPEGSRKYAVINAVEDVPFFRLVADALAQTCGMHRLDAIQAAKDRPFIFHADCPQRQAQALERALSQQGVAAVVVPVEYFTRLSQAHPLANADCLPGCFEAQPPAGKTLRIEWRDIAMIAYGRVEHRERKTRGTVGSPDGGVLNTYVGPNPGALAGMGVPRRVRPKLDISDKERVGVHDCLDVFVGYLKDDEFAGHFRVLADSFYYDYLGDRIQPTSDANFRLFVSDVVHYAPDALLTEKTRRFLAGMPAGKPIKGFPLFDEYNRWSVAIARARADGAA